MLWSDSEHCLHIVCVEVEIHTVSGDIASCCGVIIAALSSYRASSFCVPLPDFCSLLDAFCIFVVSHGCVSIADRLWSHYAYRLPIANDLFVGASVVSQLLMLQLSRVV